MLKTKTRGLNDIQSGFSCILADTGAIPLNLGLVFTSRTLSFQSQVCIKQMGPACLCIPRLHAFWSVLRYTRPHLVKQRHHPLEQKVLLCSLEGCRANTFSWFADILCIALSASLSLHHTVCVNVCAYLTKITKKQLECLHKAFQCSLNVSVNEKEKEKNPTT